MTTVKNFPYLGTVHSDSMLERDLIPAFMDVLKELDNDRYLVLCEEYDYYETTDANYCTCPCYCDNDDCTCPCKCGFEKDPFDFETENAHYLLETLFDALNDCAPDNHYFGAHVGNGSDYGFWESEDW